MSNSEYTLYVDGACKGNPGLGGWGAFIQNNQTGAETELWGGAPETTNNRMELQAAIEGVSFCPENSSITLWTDSSYVQQGITSWIHGWKQKNWRKADGKPVINADLWQQLDRLNQRYHIEWKWIKGHAGNSGNEKADALANRGVIEPEGGIQKKNSANMNELPPATNDQVTLQKNMSSSELLESEFDVAHLSPVPMPKKGMLRQLVLDTETTGFDALRGDRMIEIGIIEYVNRRPTGEKVHIYFNPQRKVGDSVNVHGLTDDFLSDKDLFGNHAARLFSYLKDTQIIAHNASFDIGFLDAEFKRAKQPPISEYCEVIDTLVIARKKHPGQKNSLDALVKRYDVTARDRTFHGALLDAEILADVYLAMTGGQVSLDMNADSGESPESYTHRSFSGRSVYLKTASSEEVQLHQSWCDTIAEKGGSHFF